MTKAMTNIEQTLKDICRQKGLTLTDVANRIGTSPSNLLSSIKGNPTIARLQNIADALQINVSQLIEDRPTSALGLAIIDGKTYQLCMPSETTVQLPNYQNYNKLEKDIRKFVKECIARKTALSMMALVESTSVFALIYNPGGELFHLSICYGAGNTVVLVYDKYLYAVKRSARGKDDIVKRFAGGREELEWEVDDLMEDIMADIEESAASTIEARRNSPHYDKWYTEEPF